MERSNDLVVSTVGSSDTDGVCTNGIVLADVSDTGTNGIICEEDKGVLTLANAPDAMLLSDDTEETGKNEA